MYDVPQVPQKFQKLKFLKFLIKNSPHVATSEIPKNGKKGTEVSHFHFLKKVWQIS